MAAVELLASLTIATPPSYPSFVLHNLAFANMTRFVLRSARAQSSASRCPRCGRLASLSPAAYFSTAGLSAATTPSQSSPPAYRLLLLDTAGIMYRAHYGYSSSPLIRPSDSRHVSALYSLCNLVLSLLSSYRPTHILAALDMPSAPTGVPSYRRSLLPSYKANRAPTPTDLSWQLSQAQRVLDAMGVIARGDAGYEADDVIASAVSRAHRDAGEGEVGIVSQDKDFVQLLRPNIALLRFTTAANATAATAATKATAATTTLQSSTFPSIPLFDSAGPQSPSPQLSSPVPSSFVSYSSAFSLSPFTAEHCHLRYGIPPSSFVDYLALVGDASDNIPGVSAIGPKTATSLLQRYHTLDAVIDAAKRGDIVGGKREQRIHRALVDEEHAVRQWRELVRMRHDLPVPSLGEMAVAGWESEERVERVVRLMEEMEFPSLVHRMRRIADDERNRKQQLYVEEQSGGSNGWPELTAHENRTVQINGVSVQAVLTETEELATQPRKRTDSVQQVIAKAT